MKCSDIPDKPILEMLARNPGEWHNLYLWNELDLQYAMPVGVPPKLARAKMKRLFSRGLVNGCTCGCRGDFTITGLGLNWLGENA